ncbi:response regulator [Caulobacter sp. BK020]|uniref:response regulator transcription factor n=1 Tax=Caulobacter sp. BK020 TaxID=2512117 RepID=UPI00104B202B|nr:response regulator [Caulobacter sp. BK020]TCS03921.1 response regulator receiver protein [Caulobacter sp. BK020]
MTQALPIKAEDRARLLLVEDDPGVRRSLQLLLRGRGFEVRAYASGLALLADPTALGAVCLVADYRMPEIDGLLILGRLRDLGWQGQAVLITAFPSARLLDQALAAGYSRVVEKPMVEAALVDAVERAVAGR